MTVRDVHGTAHEVEVRLTEEEHDERRETIVRKVADGLGLPSKREKAGASGGSGSKASDAEPARGALWMEVELTGPPADAVEVPRRARERKM